jgi:hypothetical protein
MDGPRTTFKIFGSPMSPSNGMWAFGYGPDEAHNVWDRIPLDSDIVLTHTPAKYHCDEIKARRAAGCEELRLALWRVRPRLAICGHVHEGRGAERVAWDLDNSNIKFKEASADSWIDPGLDNKKMSLIDLSTKSRFPLDNDGSTGNWKLEREETITQMPSFTKLQPTIPSSELPSPYSKKRTSSKSPQRQRVVERALSCVATGLLAVPPEALPLATLGQGGIPPSKRCDLEALSGRMGRRETCIINASIMASSYPHSGLGGKKYNKPIVVEIDLPTWS